jgi:hypothetical protein
MSPFHVLIDVGMVQEDQWPFPVGIPTLCWPNKERGLLVPEAASDLRHSRPRSHVTIWRSAVAIICGNCSPISRILVEVLRGLSQVA